MRVEPSIGRLVGELLREVGAQLEVLTASVSRRGGLMVVNPVN